MPVFGALLSGNSSDKTFNFQALQQLSSQLTAEDIARLVYVADSQMVTAANLERIDTLRWRFISRLPSVYSLADGLKAKAWEEDRWIDIGPLSPGKRAASYRLQEFSEQLHEQPYRFVVVSSSSLEKRKEQTLECAIVRERSEMEQQANLFAKISYACAEDAQAALEAFVAATSRWWEIDAQILQQDVLLKRPQRGAAEAGHRAPARDPLPYPTDTGRPPRSSDPA